MNEIKLSIIIPVYNVEKYINKCLDSVFEQDLDSCDYEVIIVNDGTPDNSMNIVGNYIPNHPNIRILNQQNQGLSMARNNALQIAKGEYIWFVDSDDTIVTNCISLLVKTLSEQLPDILTTLLCRIDEDKNLYTYDTYSSFLHANTIISGKDYLFDEGKRGPVQQHIFKRTFLLDNQLLFFPNVYHEDGDFCLRAFYKATSVYLSTLYLYCYYSRNNSIMHTIKEKNLNDLTILYQHNIKFGKTDVRKEDYRYWKARIADLMLVQLNWGKRINNREVLREHIKKNRWLFINASFNKLFAKHFYRGSLVVFFKVLTFPSYFFCK